jgi:hypothetical protein
VPLFDSSLGGFFGLKSEPGSRDSTGFAILVRPPMIFVVNDDDESALVVLRGTGGRALVFSPLLPPLPVSPRSATEVPTRADGHLAGTSRFHRAFLRDMHAKVIRLPLVRVTDRPPICCHNSAMRTSSGIAAPTAAAGRQVSTPSFRFRCHWNAVWSFQLTGR